MASQDSVPRIWASDEFLNAIRECQTSGYAAEHPQIGCDMIRYLNEHPTVADGFNHVECWLCGYMCTRNSIQQKQYRRPHGEIFEVSNAS